MLIALFSIKGSPGATSTALALAATWPRPVVLLEADPYGGDLAYRCRAAHGGSVSANRGLLRLAAAVRDGAAAPDVVSDQAQLLACGVNLIQGITSTAQARGLAALWPAIGHACATAPVDVIADLGRLDPTSPHLALAHSAKHVSPVASTSLNSVMHLIDGLTGLAGALAHRQPGTVSAANIGPILVGPDSHAARDCADLDDLLTRAVPRAEPTQPMPYDSKALQRFEHGERAGRLRRTLLMRAARAITESITVSIPDTTNGAAPRGPQSPGPGLRQTGMQGEVSA